MRYIITAPPYKRNSAGIVVLYELQKWLIRFKQDAMMMNFNALYPIEEDDIVVYPEIVKGNPLKAKKIVRYILNTPGKLGGEEKYGEDEILVAYVPELAQYSNGPVLTVPFIEQFFHNKGKTRDIDCVWVGKGINLNHPATKNCLEITYEWPATRKELAALLNRTNTFYSYDNFTSLMTEASLCGCDIKIIDGDDVRRVIPAKPIELDEFKKQLKTFIKMTVGNKCQKSR